MSDKKVCIFTGHRTIANQDIVSLPLRLSEMVERVYRFGCTEFWCGGAMGFDRMAADAVLAARSAHPEIRLCIAVPCRDQDRLWQDAERRLYRAQLDRADHVEVLSERYYDGCMRERNLWMANRADVCIAYVNSYRSGSAQTMRMVEKKLGGNALVFNLARQEQFL